MKKYANKFSQGARVIDKYSLQQIDQSQLARKRNAFKAQSCVPILTMIDKKNNPASISPLNQNNNDESLKRNSEEANGKGQQQDMINSLRTLVVERRGNVSKKIDEAPSEFYKVEEPAGDKDEIDLDDVVVRRFSNFEFEEENCGGLRLKNVKEKNGDDDAPRLSE